jgi:hypothetical protein
VDISWLVALAIWKHGLNGACCLNEIKLPPSASFSSKVCTWFRSRFSNAIIS